MIRLGLCCMFRDQPTKFVTTTSLNGFVWRSILGLWSKSNLFPESEQIADMKKPCVVEGS